MRHDLFWSSRDHERSTSKFDLRSVHRNDLSRSCCISVNASRQDKQFGTCSHVSISFLSKVMDRKRTLLWHIVTSSGHNTFLSINFDRKEIETWGRSQFVCLDETHGLIWYGLIVGPVAQSVERWSPYGGSICPGFKSPGFEARRAPDVYRASWRVWLRLVAGRSQSKSAIGTGRARLCAYVKLSTLNSAIDQELRDRKVEDRANATSSA